MNAVEIEAAISELAEAPFDAAEFPYAFLAAFGNKETTIKRLRSGESNRSDVPGGVLQRNNIHIAVAPEGEVGATLNALRESPQTVKGKAKFILATDGQTLEAEELVSHETIVCEYREFPQKLGFFLPLAGITTLKEIKDNPIDIRATSRLNKLYVELLRENPDWATDERREAMNHFMARLIFCFFAEDTGILHGRGLFTQTVEQFSERDGSNTHEIISAIFRAMNVPLDNRAAEKTPNWANNFPYVNGGLFSGDADVPRFTRAARGYLIHAGGLNWQEINPDIFGSMIQAVADEEERGALGMHYTSVPNILKVLNPLFLDDLRAKLEEAGENTRMLLNLRKRMSRIRVFDPACGSGNFLVIAYKEMRAIEAEINQRRGEKDRRSDIRLTNFRGIEIRSFPAEIARLALIIAEFQCDVRYRGQKEALLEFLPLDAQNWITCGNALRIDWLSICPPTGTKVKLKGDDLFNTPLDQAQIDFENEGGETYICGNPPYLGGKSQTDSQKNDLKNVFESGAKIGELDYVSGWIYKSAKHISESHSTAGFVTTNSINQGAQVYQLWEKIYSIGIEIKFAFKNLKWSNNAANNAAVICSIIGLGLKSDSVKFLFENGIKTKVDRIGPYLVSGNENIVLPRLLPISQMKEIITGNSPYDGGNLLLSAIEKYNLESLYPAVKPIIKRIYGSRNFLNGEQRFCLWITHDDLALARKIPEVEEKIKAVRTFRETGGQVARGLVNRAHQFRYTHQAKSRLIIIPRVSSERRSYIPFGFLSSDGIVSDSAQAIYDPELWMFSVISSLLHMSWVRITAGKLKSDFRYSSALCYNTFPVPSLTDRNRADLTRSAENILLAREAHFPATIADLYDPEKMPENLRQAHEENDETLERIYIGRRFKNDTERLEKLFEMYSEMMESPRKHRDCGYSNG